MTPRAGLPAARLKRLSGLPFPVAECRATRGVLILRHRVNGQLTWVSATCGAWCCVACGSKRAEPVLEAVRRQCDVPVWWMTIPAGDETARARLRRRAARKRVPYIAISREGRTHILTADELSGRKQPTASRRLTPEEALLLTRFLLEPPGVVRVTARGWKSALKPSSVWARLDLTSARLAEEAERRALAVLEERHQGLELDIRGEQPTLELADEVATELMLQLKLVREELESGEPCDEDGWPLVEEEDQEED